MATLKQYYEEMLLSIEQLEKLVQLYDSTNRLKNFDSILTILEKIPLIARVRKINGKSTVKTLVDRSTIVEYKSNTQIYRNQNRRFGVVLAGTARYCCYDFNRALKPGMHFGNATTVDNEDILEVKSTQDCIILHVCLRDMYRIFETVIPFPDLLLQYENLRKICVFRNLDKRNMFKIIDQQLKITYTKGNLVYLQGAEPQYLYIIIKGQFSLYKKQHRLIPISTLSVSELLGLQELVNNTNYMFTAKCNSSEGILGRVPKELILQILDNCDLDNIDTLFSRKQQLRTKRMEQAGQLNERIQNQLTKTSLKINFREKQKFYTETIIKKNDMYRTYLTNKSNQIFDTEQSFYDHKITGIQNLIKKRFAKQIQPKPFSDILSDFIPRKRVLSSRSRQFNTMRSNSIASSQRRHHPDKPIHSALSTKTKMI